MKSRTLYYYERVERMWIGKVEWENGNNSSNHVKCYLSLFASIVNWYNVELNKENNKKLKRKNNLKSMAIILDYWNLHHLDLRFENSHWIFFSLFSSFFANNAIIQINYLTISQLARTKRGKIWCQRSNNSKNVINMQLKRKYSYVC